jgi:hypothetical protein
MSDSANGLQPIRTREDFVEFVRLLLLSLQQDDSKWENRTLEDYLGAMQSWMEDMDGYYLNKGGEPPTNIRWDVFADILQAASVYE